MHVINAMNVNDGFYQLTQLLASNEKLSYDEVLSDGGLYRRFKAPVTVIYRNPNQRFLYHPIVNLDPYKQILDGLNWLHNYKVTAGKICKNLSLNSISVSDVEKEPAGARAVFEVVDGAVDVKIFFTVTSSLFTREEVFRISLMQEYVSSKLMLPMGRLYYIACANYIPKDDAGIRVIESVINNPQSYYNFYLDSHKVTSLFDDGKPLDAWDEDLEKFLNGGDLNDIKFEHSLFFGSVMTPLFLSYQAYQAYKGCRMERALEYAEAINSPDIGRACVLWLERVYGV